MGKRKLFWHLNQARHSSMKFLDQECLRNFGVSAAQASSMMFLSFAPGCQMKDLSQNLNIDLSVVSGLVKRLEKLNMVERSKSPEDGRAVLLHLTQEGERKIDEIKPYLEKVNKFIESSFEDEELKIVEKFLTFMRDDFPSFQIQIADHK